MSLFKGRSVTEVMILVFTFLVAFAILGLTLMVIIVKLRDPRANLDRSIDALASFLSAILGALLGLIAGKRSSDNGSTTTQPSSNKEAVET